MLMYVSPFERIRTANTSPHKGAKLGACQLGAVKKRPQHMAFSTRPSTYRIEAAATGRARCRRCKQCIRKGELRVAITAFVRPGRSTLLYRCARAECLTAAFARAVLATYKTPNAVPATTGVDPRDAQRVRAILGDVSLSQTTDLVAHQSQHLEWAAPWAQPPANSALASAALSWSARSTRSTQVDRGCRSFEPASSSSSNA